MRLKARASPGLLHGSNVCATLHAASVGEKWRVKRGSVTLSGNGMLPISGLGCRGRGSSRRAFGRFPRARKETAEDRASVFLLSLLLSPISCSDFGRVAAKIGATRFELATSRSRTVRSIQAELRPVNACVIDLSDLAGSVNSINSASGWEDGSTLTLDHRLARSVPAVFGRSS
jgi:hypothetical protein